MDSEQSKGDIIPKIQNAYLRCFPRKFEFCTLLVLSKEIIRYVEIDGCWGEINGFYG